MLVPYYKLLRKRIIVSEDNGGKVNTTQAGYEAISPSFLQAWKGGQKGYRNMRSQLFCISYLV
jgi:hypothetical protein